jgi:hypothetical protein
MSHHKTPTEKENKEFSVLLIVAIVCGVIGFALGAVTAIAITTF